MPICSYLVIPAAGAGPTLRERLTDLPGCDFVAAENRDLLLLVTDTESRAEEDALRETIEAMEEIRALLLVFGEVQSNPGVEPPRPKDPEVEVEALETGDASPAAALAESAGR
jgi:nitrate reductase NapAB chaperone NapD